MKGVERWGDIGRSRLWRKEASTRFDHSTDEASAELGEHIIWILCYELIHCRRGIGQAAGSLRPRNGLRGYLSYSKRRAQPTLGGGNLPPKGRGREQRSSVTFGPRTKRAKPA